VQQNERRHEPTSQTRIERKRESPRKNDRPHRQVEAQDLGRMPDQQQKSGFLILTAANFSSVRACLDVTSDDLRPSRAREFAFDKKLLGRI
jgi:hypothetical protein